MSFGPSVEHFLSDLFGRESAIGERVCVFCAESVTDESFRDEISLKEYSISGLCQACQDEVFTPEDTKGI